MIQTTTLKQAVIWLVQYHRCLFFMFIYIENDLFGTSLQIQNAKHILGKMLNRRSFFTDLVYPHSFFHRLLFITTLF